MKFLKNNFFKNVKSDKKMAKICGYRFRQGRYKGLSCQEQNCTKHLQSHVKRRIKKRLHTVDTVNGVDKVNNVDKVDTIFTVDTVNGVNSSQKEKKLIIDDCINNNNLLKLKIIERQNEIFQFSYSANFIEKYAGEMKLINDFLFIQDRYIQQLQKIVNLS
jgi:hypothetical protein